jgi:hypothetical protein
MNETVIQIIEDRKTLSDYMIIILHCLENKCAPDEAYLPVLNDEVDQDIVNTIMAFLRDMK